MGQLVTFLFCFSCIVVITHHPPTEVRAVLKFFFFFLSSPVLSCSAEECSCASKDQSLFRGTVLLSERHALSNRTERTPERG